MTNDLEFRVNEEAAGGVTLDSAVLIYRGANSTAFATVHPIHHDEAGVATLLPGRAMTTLAVARMARRLAKGREHGGFIPANLLYQDITTMAWWVPPARRHIWFRCAGGELGATERGESVPHPGLVFAVSSERSWCVWAVQGSERPAEGTPLFQAPYFNVYATGAICQGNVDVPAGTTADKIEAWNKVFFESFFTHPNVQGQLVNYQGGSYKFWRDMLDGRHTEFPGSALVPLGLSLAQAIARVGPDGP
jgi:PRTRC genetic system protein B